MLSDWILRVRSVVRRRAVEEELDDELRFHLEAQAESFMRQGMTPDAARRRARVEFGGLEQIKEEHRDARGVSLVDDLRRDLRYAARQLRRSPAFTMIAVLCLGLGIGVNTAIFSVINAMLLRHLPVAAPERLITVSLGETPAFSYPAYQYLQARTTVLSGLATSFPMESDLDVDGDSSFLAAEAVSGNYGAVLGVHPALGRWFATDRERAVVISHAVWQRRFSFDPRVLGRTIRSESQVYTIVGVAPREFSGLSLPMRTDLWVPIQTRPSLFAQLEERGQLRLPLVFARLRDGVTTAQAAAELNGIDQRRIRELGDPTPAVRIVAETLSSVPARGSRRRVQGMATLLAVVSGLVLLIACMNVGNLLLTRGAFRQREFAVRRALGASRLRLLRQLLTESLLLAAGGGICGVILGMWTDRLLVMSLPAVSGIFPLSLDPSLDWRVLVFATVVSLATTVLGGLLPAWRTSRSVAPEIFKTDTERAVPRRRSLGLVVQVAVSLLLLFVAGSFLQALLKLHTANPGFTIAGRLYAYTFIGSPPFTPEQRDLLYSEAADRVRALPGVRAAAFTSSLPLTPSGSECVSLGPNQRFSATGQAVSSSYFAVMGIGVIAGRAFEAQDLPMDSATAVVVNESLAARLWPAREAIGQRLQVGCDAPQTAVVIGVVRDTAVHAVGEPPQPQIYRRFGPQTSAGVAAMVLDVTAEPSSLSKAVRRALLGAGQEMRVYAVEPLSVHVGQSYANVRWLAAVLAGFGLLALVLAGVGLHGVIAYRVSLRTQAIGIRMALGASRADVFRAIVGEGLAIVGVGVALGELITAALTSAAGAAQAGVGPANLATHVAIVAIWIVVATVACYLPAARAARIDPLVALRYE